MFKIEHRTVSGWEDAEWFVDGEPERFNTEAEGDASIDEFIQNVNEAFNAGLMDTEYDRDDYRVVPEDPA